MKEKMIISSIGEVRRNDDKVILVVKAEYKQAMKGLDMFSHISVLWWGNREHVEECRKKMTLNPPYAEDVTLGLFATRAEYHPNPICLTACPIIEIDEVKGEIVVANIDADDKTPIVDIKGYYPIFDRVDGARVPDWGFPMPDAVPETGVEIWE
jgi:tRNA (adenine37-N6)-methyltransferase